MKLSQCLNLFISLVTTPVSWIYKKPTEGPVAKTDGVSHEVFQRPDGEIPAPRQDTWSTRVATQIYESHLCKAISYVWKYFFGSKETKEVLAIESRVGGLTYSQLSAAEGRALTEEIRRYLREHNTLSDDLKTQLNALLTKLEVEGMQAFERRLDDIKTREQSMGKEGDALKSDILEFLKTHSTMSVTQKLAILKIVDALDIIRKSHINFAAVKELSKFIINDGCLKVPDDGNCLFHSIRASLIELALNDIPEDSLALRAQTLKDMRELYEKEKAYPENDRDLHHCLTAAIIEFNDKHERELKEDLELNLPAQQVYAQLSEEAYAERVKFITESHAPIKSPEEYFVKCAQPDFWGSTPELFMNAYRYKVQFIVTEVRVEDKNETVLGNCPVGNEGATQIFLKRTNQKHYDLFLEKTRDHAAKKLFPTGSI